MGDSKQISSSALQTESKQAIEQKPRGTQSSDNAQDLNQHFKKEVDKLDKIREMLFGEHVASLQDEYQKLDRKLSNDLSKNISSLRQDLENYVQDLKKQLEGKFNQLQQELLAEQSERLAQNEELNANLSRVNSDIITKIDLDLKKMDESLNHQQEESTRQLNAVARSLQDEKVDRKSLATLFTQVAKEIEGS